MSPDKDNFKAYLDQKLDERGWNLTEFSEHAGLAPSVIFRYRRGFRPTVDNARAIAEALQVPLLDVLVVSGVLSQHEALSGASAAAIKLSLAGVDGVALAEEQLYRARVAQERQIQVEQQGQALSQLADSVEQLAQHPAMRSVRTAETAHDDSN